MKLRELLVHAGIDVEATSRSMDFKDRDMLDWELRVHQAGEQADEIVAVERVYEIRSIYLEYE